MKRLLLFLLIASSFCFHSCQDDIIGESNIEEVITSGPTVTVTVAAAVSGIVTNENGEALPNVDIEYSRLSYKTDENGYFNIDDIKGNQDGSILFFTQDGYFKNYKFFTPQVASTSFLRVIMIEKGNPQKISSSTGGTHELEGGALVSFPPNAFSYESSDSLYNGEVNVYAHWFDPSDKYISQSMPGDLRGLSADGKIVQLSTYGMMAVELETPSGGALNLANGVFADLEFPLPENLRNEAPSTIVTWSLNEATVYWEEEDIAEYSEGRYNAKVSHFSFWNCDVPYPLVNISGKLVDQEGDPLPHFGICIEAVSNSITGYGWTDSEGAFNGKVPKDEELILKVKDACGNVVLEEAVGPFTNDATFGEIIINVNKQIVITGQLICNGEPVSNGYAKIFGVNNITYDIVETNNDGFFEATIILCDDLNLTVQGFDIANGKSSELIAVDTDGQTNIDLKEIMVCDEIPEFVRYKINGSDELLLVELEAGFNNNIFFINAQGVDSSSFEININEPSIGTDNRINFLFASLLNANNNFEVFNCNVDCSQVSLEIDELDEYVAGEFMGEINGTSIMGSFRARNQVQNLELNCIVEVQNASECLNTPGSIYIEFDGGVSPYEIFINGDPTPSQIQNNFTLDNLGGGTYNIVVVDANGRRCENNVTVNNDGDITCQMSISPTNCDAENGALEVEVFGGSGDYSYMWSNGVEGQAFIDNLNVGTYSVVIEDLANGCVTFCEGFVYPNDSLFVSINFPDNICSETQSYLYPEVLGGSPPFDYLWSDGSTEEERENVSEGVYAVTVSDANGCSAENEVTIVFDENTYDIVLDVTHTGCNNGEPFGTIEASAPDIPNPSQFEWSTGSTEPSIEATFQQVYNVTIYDDAGCYGEAEVVFDPEDVQTIRGFTWDENPNGNPNVYDVFLDSLLFGITVELYNVDDLNTIIDQTITDQDGQYAFKVDQEGTYTVRFYDTGVVGYELVNTNFGMNDDIDSDANENGFTDEIEYDGCIGITNISAGFFK